MVYHCEYRI